MTKRLNESPSGSTTSEAKKPVGAMKRTYAELTEGIQSVDARCAELGVHMDRTNSRLGDLSHLTRTLVEEYKGLAFRMEKLQDWTCLVDTRHDHQVQKLLDRVIEMAMVNSGKPDMADIYQRQARKMNDFSNQDSWAVGDEQSDDKWPPEGCDSMELKG